MTHVYVLVGASVAFLGSAPGSQLGLPWYQAPVVVLVPMFFRAGLEVWRMK